nr:uncharacterized protein LOC108011770 [Drosophila suzukii]
MCQLADSSPPSNLPRMRRAPMCVVSSAANRKHRDSISHGWLSTWLTCPGRFDSRPRCRRNFKRRVMGECVRWPPAGRAEMNMRTSCGGAKKLGGVPGGGGSGLSS